MEEKLSNFSKRYKLYSILIRKMFRDKKVAKEISDIFLLISKYAKNQKKILEIYENIKKN